MLCKTKAIVLNHIKYGDSSLIVRVLTEDFGKQSLLVHGVRKQRSRMNPYLFEPLSLLSLEMYFKQNRELQTLKEAKPAILLHTLHLDVRRSTIAMFICEILHRTIREAEHDTQLFEYIFHAVSILDVAEKGIENFHIIFLIQLSKFLGIYPKNNIELSSYQTPEKIQLRDLLDHSISDIDKLNINAANRSDLIDLLLAYYYDHLEEMGEIKTLPVLRAIFE